MIVILKIWSTKLSLDFALCHYSLQDIDYALNQNKTSWAKPKMQEHLFSNNFNPLLPCPRFLKIVAVVKFVSNKFDISKFYT